MRNNTELQQLRQPLPILRKKLPPDLFDTVLDDLRARYSSRLREAIRCRYPLTREMPTQPRTARRAEDFRALHAKLGFDRRRPAKPIKTICRHTPRQRRSWRAFSESSTRRTRSCSTLSRRSGFVCAPAADQRLERPSRSHRGDRSPRSRARTTGISSQNARMAPYELSGT